ncbi:MAG: hypothetical protein COT39_04200 [Parcubacteria group bacterium CG08_land_8_20_14_0_20_48_21]|nr:MAG: hypothetical protein COT39_04200 [Parcubacteria group bacterium CG08_land_8_20_14_0_20_48_21]PIY78101.1 MAG: hypothetical protein COY83_01720 [Parcubacteria group bacterium CG_4_10_14_0_8_um_filter_48_154]PJC39877.1 MAG: hypothetical protein CO043_01965 [Parcubacteria group bacterium CG_4_9_14_0_2_um_filter_48_40]PJE53145.1 MAG: hypothetical protein COV80_00205 [Parcubacteria group bacterium CG11_big_fil_rev_8_21_14_0_20_48_46]
MVFEGKIWYTATVVNKESTSAYPMQVSYIRIRMSQPAKKTTPRSPFLRQHFHIGLLLGIVVATILAVAVGIAVIAQNTRSMFVVPPPVTLSADKPQEEELDNRPQVAKDKLPVFVYFGNTNGDPSDDCAQVWPVRRTIQRGNDILRASVDELLKGVTEKEKTSGYITALPEGVTIRAVTFANGIATIDLAGGDAWLGFGGSCNVFAVSAQLTATLLQYPHVQKVVLMLDGNTDFLQP